MEPPHAHSQHEEASRPRPVAEDVHARRPVPMHRDENRNANTGVPAQYAFAAGGGMGVAAANGQRLILSHIAGDVHTFMF